MKRGKGPAHPRPATAWFYVASTNKIKPLAVSQRKRARSVRCSITPIRPPTDAEIERLARSLWRAVTKTPRSQPWCGATVLEQSLVRVFAREAFRRGAR